MEHGSAPMATLGCAGSDSCRARVAADRGAKLRHWWSCAEDAWRRALPPHDISCSIVWLARQAAGGESVAVASGQKLSARHAHDAAGGPRAMLPTLGAALQQQIWHRSLPPPLLPMPAARRRSALASSDFLNHFVRFDLLADSNDPHIVWKLLRRLNRWA